MRSPRALTTAAPASPPAYAGSETLWSQEHQVFYYHNTQTGESRWEPPFSNTTEPAPQPNTPRGLGVFVPPSSAGALNKPVATQGVREAQEPAHATLAGEQQGMNHTPRRGSNSTFGARRGSTSPRAVRPHTNSGGGQAAGEQGPDQPAQYQALTSPSPTNAQDPTDAAQTVQEAQPTASSAAQHGAAGAAGGKSHRTFKKYRVLLLGLLCLALTVGTGIGIYVAVQKAGGALQGDRSDGKNEGVGREDEPAPTNAPETPETPDPDAILALSLPACGENELHFLRRLEDDITVARCYGGYPWEGLPPFPMVLNCSDEGDCEYYAKNNAHELWSVVAPAGQVLHGQQEQAIRLLSQGTWGPSGEDLDAFLASFGTGPDFVGWLGEEMAKPPTLLREYFRSRTSPRTPLPNGAGSILGACDLLSRWHRFTFNYLDIGSQVNIGSLNNGKHVLSVGGVARTEVAPGGLVNFQYFTNIDGGQIADLTSSAKFVANTPDFLLQAETFEMKSDWMNKYGVRAIATLQPLTDGNYTFYIASDDRSELYLDGQLVAQVKSWVFPRSFKQTSFQRSASIYLVGLQQYELRVLYKEGAGSDHLSVAWTGPGISNITILARPYLVPTPGFPALAASYVICDVKETVGGEITLSETSCESPGHLLLSNSAIFFTNPNPAYVTTWSESHATLTNHPFLPDVAFLTAWSHSASAACSATGRARDAFLQQPAGTFWRLDPRLRLLENTLSHPVDEQQQGAKQCPTTVRTFVNEDSCVSRKSCAPLSFQAASVTLDEATLRLWWTANSLPVYYMDGLRLEYPYNAGPCQKGRSRWRPVNTAQCTSNTGATLADGSVFSDTSTAFVLQTALYRTKDPNPYLRDIVLNSDDANLCLTAAASTAGIKVGFEVPTVYVAQYVTYEYYKGITGTRLSSLFAASKFPNTPDQVVQASTFYMTANTGDDYGVRARVYLIPPQSGNFTFYIASDDNSRLDVDNVTVAYVDGWTGAKEWSKYSGQRSAKVFLEAHTRYLLEAYFKEATGGDHLEVAWIGPGIPVITIIGEPYIETYSSNPAPYSPPSTALQCWEHVHQDYFQVLDFTQWAQIHDGNEVATAAGRSNPIERTAKAGSNNLYFPSFHPMQRWNDRRWVLLDVGRFGDTLDFSALATNLQTREMALAKNALANSSSNVGFEVCGSPGEKDNNPVLGHLYHFKSPDPDQLEEEMLDRKYWRSEGKSAVFTNVAFKAPDQLRNRVAWATSQIFTLSATGLDLEDAIEPWTHYFDIFVRHAFGNYRDMMREVAYSPMMGDYLTYRQNQAFSFSGKFPDENFAREIMQLFSIGLWELQDDGTPITDEYGNFAATYTNDDIVTFARIWTGFDRQSPRSNYEAPSGLWSQNYFDPMLLKPAWRDRFPKTALTSGYIGDGFPPCNSLPAQHFLTKGALFVLTGSSSQEGEEYDDAAPDSPIGLRGRFAPNPATSSLYAQLCSRNIASGACTFPAQVLLAHNLACDGEECDAGEVRTVKISDAATGNVMYYTYWRTPCVRMTFFSQGKVLQQWNRKQCGDSTAAIGGPLCCQKGKNSQGSGVLALAYGPQCLFSSERLTYAQAEQRCVAAANQTLGKQSETCSDDFNFDPGWKDSCAGDLYVWRNRSCQVKVQVWPQQGGSIGIVDELQTVQNMPSYLKVDSGNFFRVRWDRSEFPTPQVENCGSGCTPGSAGSCLCNVHVVDQPVFGATTTPPSQAAVESKLFIGAPEPSSFPVGYYEKVVDGDESQGQVDIYIRHGTTGWNMEAIFALAPRRRGGKPRFLFNRQSKVWIGDGSRYGFRNPPNFMPLLGEYEHTWRQFFSDSFYLKAAENEVEALLDHLFEHENTATFVAYRLIQRLVTSNPSARYMNEVVRAFRTGQYESFGSQRYGDLEATIAAIYLDREARTPLLDFDPHYGRLREPLEKILHLMRAMEHTSRTGVELLLHRLREKVGQESFNAPSVFGFYLPEYTPDGRVAEALLVAPEAQVVTAPQVIALTNGLFSLVDVGLTSCSYGFGNAAIGRNCWSGITTIRQENDGSLAYSRSGTASQVIAHLALFLTGNRLAAQSRQVIQAAYEAATESERLRTAQKLFSMVPEFHATGGNRITTIERQPEPVQQSQGRRYKAIVVIFQSGGFDSFNLITPHSECQGKDYYQEYAEVRQGAALGKQPDADRIAANTDQPCTYFQVHPSMPTLRSLYKAQDAAFVANVGALVEPVTKQEFIDKSKALPPSLFAHNIMQRHMHSLDPLNGAAKGVLGRTVDALMSAAAPFASELYSLIGNIKMLEGQRAADMIDPWNGVTRFQQFPEFGDEAQEITQKESENMMADTWSRLMRQSIDRAEKLSGRLGAVTLTETFPKTYFGMQLMQVAKLIKLRQNLTTERAVFVTQQGGFDTHNTFDLDASLAPIDDALDSFVKEMKMQGIWDDVVVFSVSDFGRTLTSNGAGTDHAWGGNHFIASGSLKGGKIFGQYPETLTDESELSIGRGRLIPTSSWECIWDPIVRWFGVLEGSIAHILPNVANFATQVIPQSELFLQTA
eukprot:g22050.t1